MTDVSLAHEEKEILVVDINIPGHEIRTTTKLFTKSKKFLSNELVAGATSVAGLQKKVVTLLKPIIISLNAALPT